AISGATPSAFNGTFTIEWVDDDNFTYTLPSDQGDAAGSIVATSGSGSVGALADIISWVRGQDNFEDENSDASTTDGRSSMHGDVLHSRPAVVNYNRHGNDDDVYIFYGANDGIFRAVKGGFNQSDIGEPMPGTEAWGFIPEEFFSSLERLRDNEPTISSSNKKAYFADGTIGVYVNDVNNDDELNAADGDIVWLFISMHRGGRLLYALDVSDPSDPKLLWKKSNNDTGWAELGQTWSAPTIREIQIDTGSGDDNDEEVVLVFGAGYDPTVEDVPPEDITAVTSTTVVAGASTYTRSMGRGIFVVDAASGDILWQAGPSGSNPSAGHTFKAVSGMDYAIASDVVVITDRSGAIDNRAYVGDTGGNIWRVDMADADNDGDVADWTVTKVASVADTGTIPGGLRKFLFPPDVVHSDDGYDAILIGSGDREHPFDSDVVNRFYMFKDTGIGTTPIRGTGSTTGTDTTLLESDLFEATDNCAQYEVGDAADPAIDTGTCTDTNIADAHTALTTGDGWFITLGSGEKVVGNAVTLNEVTFFNTNQPSTETSTSCDSDLGTARQYTVKFDDATAIADQNIDGSTDATDRSKIHAGGGYLPSPVPVVVEIDGEVHEGVISGVSVDDPPGSLLNARLRKFWYKEME
ncbi:MAG: hypothetical protein V3R68_05220, partial [Gammaproteobacteria bacterium]